MGLYTRLSRPAAPGDPEDGPPGAIAGSEGGASSLAGDRGQWAVASWHSLKETVDNDPELLAFSQFTL